MPREIDYNDPLSMLLVPHEVIEWQKRQGLLMKKHFPKEHREKGKFAIFHGKLQLNKLYKTELEAKTAIDEIVGDKRKCIENKRVYSVKQL